jgi:hypothetical protein
MESPVAPAPRRSLTLSSWLPVVIAVAVLMIPIGSEANAIHALRDQLAVEKARKLPAPDPLESLRLVSLAARPPGNPGAVTVAWNVQSHRGMVLAQDLTAAPAGAGYRLWVLDPTAAAPIAAGPLPVDRQAHEFAAPALGTATPGFAVTLEPSAAPALPSGAILFAVAPGE